MNLSVINSIKDDHCVSQALELCRKVLGAFSLSWKKRRDLRKAHNIEVEMDLPQHSLIGISQLIQCVIDLFIFKNWLYFSNLNDRTVKHTGDPWR